MEIGSHAAIAFPANIQTGISKIPSRVLPLDRRQGRAFQKNCAPQFHKCSHATQSTRLQIKLYLFLGASCSNTFKSELWISIFPL
jgi:hypothetical protein